MPRPFQQVDVFTSVAYLGNPLAIVLNADGIDDAGMQRFATWTNLSETTFVLQPTTQDADYRVRIFTTTGEVPFAGHPTLGTCHAWLSAGGRPRDESVVVQECGSGLIPVRRDGDRLAFAEPPLIRGGPVDEATVERAAAQLRISRSEVIDAQWADNGPGWVALLLASAEAVLAVRPGIVDLDIGVVGPHARGRDVAWEVRAFFPKDGATAEDPVTGSLIASVAGWLIRSGRASAPWVVAQGTAMGRAGRAFVSQDPDGTIWVGGGTVTGVSGAVEL